MPEYTVIDWNEKNDIQKLLTVLEIDAGNALNTALQYKYLLEFFDNNLPFVNRAVCFWREVMTSFRYSLLMQLARLFDESRDAISMKKMMDILEQSQYQNTIKAVLKKTKNEYDSHQDTIRDIRNLRDKIYAHNDKVEYKDWNYDGGDPLDSPIWEKAEEILRWAKDVISVIRELCGDNVPLYFETRNDIGNLLEKSY